MDVSCPGSKRTMLSWFLAVVCLFIVTVILLCVQSCSEAPCIGSCNFYNLKPVLANADRRDHSNVDVLHPRRRLPTCIIIGVRKAGTRALLTYLDIHPDIVVARHELHFFGRETEYHKGLEYYRQKMPYSFKHKITIEKSPSYFVEPRVPERVFRMNSSVLILLIVREPVIRLISDYVQTKMELGRKGKAIASFENEVMDENGDIRTHYKAVETSVYSIHLGRWLKFFPLKQIHIVDGEALIENPHKELHDVETFLGLEHRIKQDNFFFSETKGFYCINVGNSSTCRCLGVTKGMKHPEINTLVIKKLRQFYIARNPVFFKMANRTFNWSDTDA